MRPSAVIVTRCQPAGSSSFCAALGCGLPPSMLDLGGLGVGLDAELPTLGGLLAAFLISRAHARRAALSTLSAPS